MYTELIQSIKRLPNFQDNKLWFLTTTQLKSGYKPPVSGEAYHLTIEEICDCFKRKISIK